MIFAKLKGYLIAFGVAAIAVIAAYFKGSGDQKNKIKVKQKDIELKAHKAAHKAEKQATKTTRKNNEKADNSDFSGFDR